MSNNNLKRSEKLQLLLDEQELKAIDDWRFANRLPSRAAALRELLRRGLISTDFEDQTNTDNQSTGDFRVVDPDVKAVLRNEASKKAAK